MTSGWTDEARVYNTGDNRDTPTTIQNFFTKEDHILEVWDEINCGDAADDENLKEYSSGGDLRGKCRQDDRDEIKVKVENGMALIYRNDQDSPCEQITIC